MSRLPGLYYVGMPSGGQPGWKSTTPDSSLLLAPNSIPMIAHGDVCGQDSWPRSSFWCFPITHVGMCQESRDTDGGRAVTWIDAALTFNDSRVDG